MRVCRFNPRVFSYDAVSWSSCHQRISVIRLSCSTLPVAVASRARNKKLRTTRASSIKSRRCHQSVRLLKYLVVGLVGVSGICWANLVVKGSAAHRKNGVAAEVGDVLGDVGRTSNVWLEHGWEEWSKAGRSHADLAAPTVRVIPSHLRMLSRGIFALCFIPPNGRGSLHEGGAQARWSWRYCHETSVVFLLLRSAVVNVSTGLLRKKEEGWGQLP